MANYIGREIVQNYVLNLSGFLKPSGINTLYVLPARYILSLTYNTDDAITHIDTGSHQWFKIDVLPENCFFNEKKIEDKKTGAVSWEQTLTFQVYKNEALIRKQMHQFNNSYHSAIFIDNNSKTFLIGNGNGLSIEAEIQSGKLLSEFNGQTLFLKGVSSVSSKQVVGTNPYNVSVTACGGITQSLFLSQTVGQMASIPLTCLQNFTLV